MLLKSAVETSTFRVRTPGCMVLYEDLRILVQSLHIPTHGIFREYPISTAIVMLLKKLRGPKHF